MLVFRIAFGIICLIATVCITSTHTPTKVRGRYVSIATGIVFVPWSILEIYLNPHSFINWFILLAFIALLMWIYIDNHR